MSSAPSILPRLAIPSACILLAFHQFSSQYLFAHLDLGPDGPTGLGFVETVFVNVLGACIWICYARTCLVDPGDYRQIGVEGVVKGVGEGDVKGKLGGEEMGGGETESEDGGMSDEERDGAGEGKGLLDVPGARWCKKCDAVKPARAHHCRQCKRCIPKMDHHCPWTSNCVSHTTFPHFLRFISYACFGLSYLLRLLYIRLSFLWSIRHLPSSTSSPPFTQIAHLCILTFATSLTLFTLSILLVTSLKSLVCNTTMIEYWEIERHEALLDRASRNGGYVYAPGGRRVYVRRQEFPYDVGWWRNCVQGMGTGNLLLWFWPFAKTPSMEDAREWETNGFQEEGEGWPPVDPERMGGWGKRNEGRMRGGGFTFEGDFEGFRERQEKDLRRWRRDDGGEEEEGDEEEMEIEEGLDGEAGWTNSDGDRLRDYGVDEEVDDDDIPLGVLLRRRKNAGAVVDRDT